VQQPRRRRRQASAITCVMTKRKVRRDFAHKNILAASAATTDGVLPATRRVWRRTRSRAKLAHKSRRVNSL
jgi:hypothetical protein